VIHKIRKIISGGQTGADRAAFDFALEQGIEISGFVPKNRMAEDGEISAKYPNLLETRAKNPVRRTEMNVKYSDATLILSHGELTGGSKRTLQLAEKHHKPSLHLDFAEMNIKEAVAITKKWLKSINCEELNVAGARASKDPHIYGKTKLFLEKLFD
jgi:Circularly permutated YpsA SLOG family